MKTIKHKKCVVCLAVRLILPGKHMPSRGGFVCQPCAKMRQDQYPPFMPVWEDTVTGETCYHVPDELQGLSEGEKLLIQIISPYVPLQHLTKGSFGCHGHVCSFVKDIHSVCTELPRKRVEAVKVIRHFKNENNQIESKSFLVRKTKVLCALRWLCIHHDDYAKTVVINESNLDWMNGMEECELDVDIVLPDNKNSTTDSRSFETDEDNKSTSSKASANEDGDQLHRSYGVLHDFQQDCDPKTKDNDITKGIVNALAEKQGLTNTSTGTGTATTMMFPYVSPDPVNEYTENLGLFRKAFPWLFPGGKGDITSKEHHGSSVSIEKWIEYLLCYYDGRFAKDKVWSFFALNIAQRRQNQKQGGYFVNGFFDNGPKTLEEVQDGILNGNLDWVNRITYFGSRIRGSTSYWRERRSEVYTWINHHIQKGNGAPSYFITLSCAEYHWPDIKRLIQERYDLAGTDIPDISSGKGMSKYINDFTVVIQEYFQLRVKTWLDTVGKDIFGIEHYWLRFEFAPGRGQIHAHLIAITNKMKDICEFVAAIKNGTTEYGHVQNPEVLCGYVFQEWARDTLGMTATTLPTTTQQPTNQNTTTADASVHPASRYFSDTSLSMVDDANDFLNTCQNHVCSDYCLRKRTRFGKAESTKSRARRECRAGCGYEKEPGKANTPGFPIRNFPLLRRDARGFTKFEMPRTLKFGKGSKRKNPIQTSLWLAHGWRANCDLQLIIYEGDPRNPDASEIARVTDYIVAYACKGIETFTAEQDHIKEIIMATQENSGDSRDVVRLARHVLNKSIAQKVLSKQEAMVHILKLDLFLCSEKFQKVSLSNYYLLGGTQTHSNSGKAILQEYARRRSTFWDVSLNDYFYATRFHQQNKQNEPIHVIPFYTGAMSIPKFPTTNDYAKFILMVHRPWRNSFLLKRADGRKIDFLAEFSIFIRSNACPNCVKLQHQRAKFKHENPILEPTSQMQIALPDGDTPDEVTEAINLYATLHENQTVPKDCYDYDFGENYDWSHVRFPLDIDPSCWLNEQIVEARQSDCSSLLVPMKQVVQGDGKVKTEHYELADLHEDQRQIANCVLLKLREHETQSNFIPLRMTVTGQAGTGKTVLIKTLMSILRRKYQCNDVICTFGPTGCAASAVNGRTVHSGWSVSVKDPKFCPSNTKIANLRKLYGRTMVFVFDERCMYAARLIACVENYARCVVNHGLTRNSPHGWGGACAVLFFGDDSQLPSINPGCLDCVYHLNLLPGTAPRDPVTNRGIQVFLDMARHVMNLNIIKRQDATQKEFLRTLQRLRDGDCQQADVDYLMSLHLDDDRYTAEDREIIDEQSLYIFATKNARDEHNEYKLYKTHSEERPVAKIKAVHNSLKPRSAHFNDDNTPPCLRMCVGAMVALCGRNLYPEWGLYTGAIGTVVDIVFKDDESPIRHNLPLYVLVDFPSYSGPSLSQTTKTLVPITPIAVGCDLKQCNSCERIQLPLRLAFAKTGHTSQGITVGKSKPGHPPYPVQSIVCDPGTLKFESTASGLLYTMYSRATNGRIQNDNTSSAVYFHGANMNANRIFHVACREDGKPFKKVQQRRKWVKHLRKHTRSFKLTPKLSRQLRVWSQLQGHLSHN